MVTTGVEAFYPLHLAMSNYWRGLPNAWGSLACRQRQIEANRRSKFGDLLDLLWPEICYGLIG